MAVYMQFVEIYTILVSMDTWYIWGSIYFHTVYIGLEIFSKKKKTFIPRIYYLLSINIYREYTNRYHRYSDLSSIHIFRVYTTWCSGYILFYTKRYDRYPDMCTLWLV